MEISRHIAFDELTPGTIAWLGGAPTDRRIQAEFGTAHAFYVINGAWRGVLHEGEEGCLHIIDERGVRHEPIYIVDVEARPRSIPEPMGEIPF
ncbi:MULTISPECIES: hypothetical protein [unclassified Mesorhizobium]|uniref:hypothetical protein n=1 Tax=unclassified Mesorhizobium TaxID=325217 RepID=UPI001093B884|nr:MULTISPECIES: hypothetical protein [unclassified Mesorhizobium]TGT90858.1 hypothetical protein EN804_05855 [Mesorhizobium sp. M8A.F.Ca.ET.161.01.1.1]TGV43862.1 hypothetical protein EN785_07690 [Mesorhizobium sp. M8A.F.Ca.ET.142.01.1.1]